MSESKYLCIVAYAEESAADDDDVADGPQRDEQRGDDEPQAGRAADHSARARAIIEHRTLNIEHATKPKQAQSKLAFNKREGDDERFETRAKARICT